MTFLRRLFGMKTADGYDQAIGLVEDGRLTEALPLLREVYAEDQTSPRGSLAGYYLRQSLVGEGRRLLSAGDAEAACRVLVEAVQNWPEFPDLRFLAGAAAVASGQDGVALDNAQQALRRNPDYCEARLLEAAALAQCGRLNESADSLDKLVESGRRVDHVLARDLAREAQYTSESIPDDLPARVLRAAVGDDAKHRLAQAVADCRAGRWDEGLAAFAHLAGRFPRYPDIRAKHGAALYQVGKLDEALVEVEASLGVNPRYRTAVSLRGLILAERGRLSEASEFLNDAVPRLEGTAGRHEELFLSYLRATLSLLLGDRQACRDLLEGWNDLGRQFARAELLLVACDALDGWDDAALRRLDALTDLWPNDSELVFLRAAMQLQQSQFAAVEDAISHWPGGADESCDQRPLLLQARLDVARGRAPSLPDVDPAEEGEQSVAREAWQVLSVHADLLEGDTSAAASKLEAMILGDDLDEELGALALRSLSQPPAGCLPDSWLPELSCLLRRRGDGVRAEKLVGCRLRRHPQQVQWSWLSAGFWVEPVRRWLA